MLRSNKGPKKVVNAHWAWKSSKHVFKEFGFQQKMLQSHGKIWPQVTENPRVTSENLQATLSLDVVSVYGSTLRKTLNRCGMYGRCPQLPINGCYCPSVQADMDKPNAYWNPEYWFNVRYVLKQNWTLHFYIRSPLQPWSMGVAPSWFGAALLLRVQDSSPLLRDLWFLDCTSKFYIRVSGYLCMS